MSSDSNNWGNPENNYTAGGEPAARQNPTPPATSDAMNFELKPKVPWKEEAVNTKRLETDTKNASKDAKSTGGTSPWRAVFTVGMIVALTLAVVGIVILWGQRNELAQERDQLAQELAVAEEDLAGARTHIDELASQVEALRAESEELSLRIDTLAQEKASVEDDQVLAEHTIALLEQVAKTSGEVGQQLDYCIDLQLELTDVLLDVDAYTKESVDAYKDDVTGVCGEAQTLNQELTDLINDVL